MIRVPILLLAVLAALAGCETVVDVELPPHDRQLVAQGFFAPESLWAVRVSHTVGYTDPERPGWVDDAAVEVWEGGRLLERLAPRDSGLYVAAGQRPEPGRDYTLRVSAPGYEPVEGTSALPDPPAVATFDAALAPESTDGRSVVRLRVTLDDPPGGAGGYALAVLHLRARVDPQTRAVTPLPPALFPFTSGDPALEPPVPNPLDTGDPTFLQALFRNDGFDGERRTVEFTIAYDRPPPVGVDPSIQRAFVVVVASLSEALYRYAETAPEQALFGENPFAEPLRVYSNLSNGYGVFAGFSPTALPVPPDALLRAGP